MALYSVIMENQTTIANGELVTIATAAAIGTRGGNIRLHRAWAGQGGTATSQQLGIQLAVQASAFGTFSTATPRPHLLGGNASGITGGAAQAAGTAGVDASANAAGTKTPFYVDGFNNLAGWLWVPTPEERIIVPISTVIVLALIGTPTTLTNWSAGITFEELN
jgi:hypothetical protein